MVRDGVLLLVLERSSDKALEQGMCAVGAACASYSGGLSVSLGSAGSFYFASGGFGRGNILDFWWVGMMAWDGFLCRVVGRNFPLRIIISHTSTP